MVVQLVVVPDPILRGPRFHSYYWQTFAGRFCSAMGLSVEGIDPPPQGGGVGWLDGGWVGGWVAEPWPRPNLIPPPGSLSNSLTLMQHG